METAHVTRPAMQPLLEPYGLVEAVRRGNTLYLSGQTGMTDDHQIVAGGLKAQALQAFRNIRAVIEQAGGEAVSLVSLTWYLVEGADGRSFLEDATDVLAAKEEILPGLRPASTAVRVKALLLPQILIEIQAVAEL